MSALLKGFHKGLTWVGLNSLMAGKVLELKMGHIVTVVTIGVAIGRVDILQGMNNYWIWGSGGDDLCSKELGEIVLKNQNTFAVRFGFKGVDIDFLPWKVMGRLRAIGSLVVFFCTTGMWGMHSLCLVPTYSK